MKIHLIRHTAVSVEEGLCYGRSDVALAPGMEAVAAKLRGSLPKHFMLVTSPSSRCQKLAHELGSNPDIDQRFMELDFGQWEMRRWSEIPREESDPWMKDFVRLSPPAGESFGALARRVREALLCFREKARPLDLVCVTHGGVIRASLCLCGRLPLSSSFELKVPFGSLHILDEGMIETLQAGESAEI